MRLVAVSFLAACTTSPAAKDEPEPPPVEPPAPVAPWLASTPGTYGARTRVHASADVPATALRVFADAPGTELFLAAAAEHTPALAAARAAVPASIAAELPGWFEDAIRGNTAAMIAAYGYAELLQNVSQDAILDSDLTIDGGVARHRLETIYFDVQNLGDAFALDASADASVTMTATSSGGTITLGTHALVVPIGDLLYQLQDRRANGSMRGVVGEYVSCPLVAIAVANRCGAACEGDVVVFDQLCEGGLDAIFAETRATVAGYTMTIVGGSASLVDVDGDLVADHLDGAWRTGRDHAVTDELVGFFARHPL